MKLLEKGETILIGDWYLKNNKIFKDENCERIEWLIKNHLSFIKVDDESGGWERLYKDPNDQRFWECVFLESELHGGGPPTLRNLSYDEAKIKYKI